jgi:hypothetical protein
MSGPFLIMIYPVKPGGRNTNRSLSHRLPKICSDLSGEMNYQPGTGENEGLQGHFPHDSAPNEFVRSSV